MIEEPIVDAIPESSQLTFMKSKMQGLKQKLSQPFPYFYGLVPKEQEQYNQKLTELKQKIKNNKVEQQDKASLMVICLGKVEGMPAIQVPAEVLGKFFQSENKDFWAQILKDKLCQKFYGLPKQKSHSLWEVKDLEALKQAYNVQQVKKQRKIVKQYSSFYKAGHKFVDKLEKIKSQADVLDAYEEYKKVEQEDSKLNKILMSQKNKSTKVSLPQPLEKVGQVCQKIEKQIQNQQHKVQNIQQQANKKDSEVKKSQEFNEIKNGSEKDATQTKKKTEAKQLSSNKKQASKKQQITSKYKPLDFFFKKKQAEPETPKKAEISEEVKTDKTDTFLSTLGFNSQNNQTQQNLRQQFASFKKKLDNGIKTCYVTINMLRSRLQLYDFPVKEVKVDFTHPFAQKQNIRYDDSSDEYSELVADSINQQMIQEEEQQEEEESNSAIVSDSFCQYKSSHVVSSSESQDQPQNKPKPQVIRSVDKWFFNANTSANLQKYAKLSIIILVEDPLPMVTKDQTEQNTNEITLNHKMEMYKEIHGSYSPKEVLIKKLGTIVDNKMSLNKISSMIKDICEKKGNHRVLKMEIIKELAQQLGQSNPNFETELQQLKVQREMARNLEVQTKKQQKMNERDQKIEKLILQYIGEIKASLILEYLRNNQVKIIKQELNTIIKTKQGQKWEQIRNQIKKGKLLRGRPKKIKPSKNEEGQNLLNTHRPIDQILRQNMIDNMNKPKKEKKINQGQEIVNEAGIHAEDEMEQEYRDPSDDESFELREKKKKSRGSKNKKIVKISPYFPPVRKNPRRNKKKSNKSDKQQNKPQPQRQQGQKQNQIDHVEQNQMGQQEHDVLTLKEKEDNPQLTFEPKKELISPQRNPEQIQQKSQQNAEKTANKPETNESVVENMIS